MGFLLKLLENYDKNSVWQWHVQVLLQESWSLSKFEMGWKAAEKLIRHWKILRGDNVRMWLTDSLLLFILSGLSNNMYFTHFTYRLWSLGVRIKAKLVLLSVSFDLKTESLSRGKIWWGKLFTTLALLQLFCHVIILSWFLVSKRRGKLSACV